jgi:hypothetical protein
MKSEYRVYSTEILAIADYAFESSRMLTVSGHSFHNLTSAITFQEMVKSNW